MEEKPYYVLAYYLFSNIENPKQEVADHKAFFEGRDVTSRIYISEQGINGQMSAAKNDAIAYMEWMHGKAPFQKMPFKIHSHHEQVYPRTTVKYRKQLVALDADVDLSKQGEHVSPQKWKEMLADENKPIVLDVRNDYEWKIGHFEGAELPECESFREFTEYADNLKSKVDPQKKTVMMYCTGGIRCELYSAVLKNKGFDKVYQLDGGVINYGLQLGNDHWKGKLFVFDDRLAIPLAEKNNTIVGKCEICNKSNDSYYNCANMDCNKLFICCKECVTAQLGCCCEGCKDAPRLRPYHKDTVHKPFRRRDQYLNK